MTYNELKNKLEELRGKKRLFKQLEMQISEEKAAMDGIKAVNYENGAVRGVGGIAVQQRFVEHMENLCAVRNRVLSEMFEIEEFISAPIKELSVTEQNMLVDRYVNGKPWRKIQEEYGYEEAQPYRIVSSAIKKICRKMKDDRK